MISACRRMILDLTKRFERTVASVPLAIPVPSKKPVRRHNSVRHKIQGVNTGAGMDSML
jgi:hypothetical protein